MEFVFGALAGLVWGALAALLNREINKKALEKNSTNAMLAANMARTAVDIAALAAVFFLRKVLPFRFEAMLVGTAVSLSLLTIVFSYRLVGEGLKKDADKTNEEE